MEQIVPGSVIMVGKNEQTRSVVSAIRPGRAEVVYLDQTGRALHQEIEWRKGAWEFLGGSHGGRPADRDGRLEPYVKMLRVQ
ncbi:MAG: hypothetical protein FJ119_13150 [Deltaproteobacteria bacterium]|nr:hypothetical protein [Deltaproteobacteria bacterium]